MKLLVAIVPVAPSARTLLWPGGARRMLGEMAGRAVTRARMVGERRLDVRADVLRLETARAEGAAARSPERIGQVAFEDDVAAAALRRIRKGIADRKACV